MASDFPVPFAPLPRRIGVVSISIITTTAATAAAAVEVSLKVAEKGAPASRASVPATGATSFHEL